MRPSPGRVWFAAFTAAFAVFAAYVFWGTWSSSVTFVSPDDPPAFDLSYADTFVRWLNGFRTTGRMLPTDVLWSGLLVSPHFCRELKYASAVYFAGLAMAWFLRGRGLSRLASYGAGLLLSLSGYWFTLFSAGHGGWFVWMTYGVFAFGLVDRAVSGGAARHWLLLGAVVAWASFNQADLWLLFTTFTGVYFVWRVAQTVASAEPGGRVALLRSLGKGCAMSAVACALVGMPGFHHALTSDIESRVRQIEDSKGSPLGGNGSDDAETRWIFATNWSLPPAETAEFFLRGVNGDTSCPFTLSLNRAKGTRPYTGALGRPYGAKTGNYRQHSLYVGWATCLFALAGALSVFAVASRPKAFRADAAFFAVAAAVFCLFSFGRHLAPVYRAVFALPFGDLLRAPVKWHHLVEFCLAALAGFGIDWIVRRFEAVRSGAVRIVVAALVLAGAASLAAGARLYCAPIDYGQAIRSRCKPQLAVLSRRQFAEAGVASLMKAGRIVSVANWLGDPDTFLVQVLEEARHEVPRPAKPLQLSLGIVSVASALGIAWFAFRTGRRRRSP